MALEFENCPKKVAQVDSGAYISELAQNESERINQQAPTNNFPILDQSSILIQEANAQLEKPYASVKLRFHISDRTFAEHSVVMKNLTGRIIGWHFMRHNSVVIDTTHGFIRFPHLTMQVKNAASETSADSQSVLTDDNLTISLETTKAITSFVDQPSEGNTTCNVTPLEKLTETASLLISYWISATIGKKTALEVTRIIDEPNLTEKTTKNAEISAVTLEQSKYIKSVDTAMLSMIQEADLDLTTYFNELLKMNKAEQKGNTFWFPTPKNPGKNGHHNHPIHTRILKDLLELQMKEE